MFLVDDANKQSLALARFEAFRSHLPHSWDEGAVSQFQEIVAALEEAYAVDLSSFRIRDADMKRITVGVSRIGYSGRRGPVQMSKERHCDERVARRQVDGIVFYSKNLQPPPERRKLGF
jgi:hypothetical protein